jgi:hypothetical protein
MAGVLYADDRKVEALGSKDRVMQTLLETLQENMLQLEVKEEERIEQVQKFEEELERRTIELKDNFEIEKKTLKEKITTDKARVENLMTEDMQRLQAECERTVAQATSESQRLVAQIQAECDRKLEESIVNAKAECARGTAEIRVACEKQLREERAEMAARIAESRANCERMAAEKEGMSGRIAEFREETERYIAHEKAEMLRKTSESRAECDRIAREKAEMMREMARFQEETQLKMAKEKEELSRLMAESREQNERKIQEEKAVLGKKIAQSKAEYDAILEEKQNVMRELQRFRAETERNMADEQQNIEMKLNDSRAQCDRKIAEEKLEMAREMAELRVEFERKLLQENDHYTKKISEARIECERMAEQKASMEKDMAKFRAETEAKMGEEKAELMDLIAQLRGEYEQIAKQKAQKEKEMTKLRADMELKMIEMTKKTAETRAECERIEAEKAGLAKEMAKFRQKTEKKMADEQAEMRKRISESRAEYEQIVVQKAELAREMSLFRSKTEQKMADVTAKMSDSKTECERLAKQKADMEKEISDIRNKTLKKLEAEKEEANRKMAAARQEYELQLQREQTAAKKQLSDARDQTERQLAAEREITSHIMQAIRELPPLQAAMELGDIRNLEDELEKWEASESLPDRFGECKGVVEAVLKLANERLLTWREVEHTLHDVLRQMQRLPGSVSALTEHCQRLFRALKEAQLTKMDLRRSDPQATDHICEVLLAWQEKVMHHSNAVQRAMIRKVAIEKNLGTFDFADLDICLRLVDRGDVGNEVLLTRALAIVEDESTSAKDMKPLLAHLETMLFFLKYTKSEDLGMCHAEFAKSGANQEHEVAKYIRWASQECPPGSELVRLQPGRDIMDRKDVASVLEEMRQVRPGQRDSIGTFREIFYQWALVMRNRFDLLVLPHHTQVVCLLIFRRFLEAVQQGQAPHKALVAQVGTGEGKSMIVAALAIYVVVAFKKKVHVVVDDETLLERDYFTFKRLFDTFRVPTPAPGGYAARGRDSRPLTSALCVSEERLSSSSGAKEPHLVSRVDPEVDICYCEAKHVQSFYASIARGQKRDFEGYEGRVLILDEVDALVIDEEPNEAFVYPNKELGRMATNMAEVLKRGAPLGDNYENNHPAAARCKREMTTEWQRGQKMVAGEDFVYAKEAGRYQALQSGRANPKAWSLALECRNFQDGLSREIVLQERLFVMSRPRVFRKYHRILGLSGSIGSEAERAFLKDTYKAAFFEVPPFLKTCRGSPFHEPVPVPLGQERKAVYVEASPEAQLQRLAEVALEARERVPVLVIAKDRGHCDQLVEGLRSACRSRGLGGNSDDVVRSLARNLYEADPEQWKENLNRSTLPVGDGGKGSKSWRVTVTDPRGGRGTDYRVDFKEVDDAGGLLLLTTIVPTAQRDWTQFLGRTARQDRHGQFCAILCGADYQKYCTKYNETLPNNGRTDTIQAILSWGDRLAAERIKASAALYNCGVRVNELCEQIFGKQQQLLENPEARERIVEACQRFRWMSITEVDEAFSKVPGLNPRSVPTEAKDLGRPQEPPVSSKDGAIGGGPSAGARAGRRVSYQQPIDGPVGPDMVEIPKVVVFCLDWSASMMSQDTGTKFTRFGICLDRVKAILREQVREQDLVGVVGFGANYQTVIPPTQKGQQHDRIQSQIDCLKPNLAGGTCFFDAVAHTLTMMTSTEHAPPESPRWLLCLTDGDDLGSKKENENGEIVTRMLEAGVTNLNMIMITVGRLKEKNIRVIEGWIDRVSSHGGFGRHLNEKDAVSIGKAFEVVAEVLAADVGGALEC